MRITQMFAVLLAVAGVSAVTPASAETSLTRSTTIAAPIAAPTGITASADQYRGRGGNRGWRGGGGNRGWGGGGGRGWRGGGNRGWRGGGYGYGYGGGYYRPRYYGYGGYRRGLVCRTSWRWGRPHRVCFRRW